MKEKTKEILNELDKTKIVNRLKELSLLIRNNSKYNKIMNEFINMDCIQENKILKVREQLFEIPELKEYLHLQNELRMLSININNIIMSILN